MKKYATTDIRNIALISHGGHGTTSLAEAFLFNTGAVNRLGSVDDGNSNLDFEEEEQERRSSVSAGIGTCEHSGKKLNLIDLPGLADFVGDVDGALRAADAAILVVSAVDGVEVRTDRLFHAARKHDLPVAVFVNKMDRERADFEGTVADIARSLGVTTATLTAPIGRESALRGVVDMIENVALFQQLDGSGNVEKGEIPGDMAGSIESQRELFVEEIAGTDEDLMEKYFEEGDLSGDELRSGLAAGFKDGSLCPVFAGSATQNVGVGPLLDFVAAVFPSPAESEAVVGTRPGTSDEVSFQKNDDAPFSAYVFKTIADKYTGQLSILRVYSGSASSDTVVFNASKDHAERFGTLMSLRGKEMTPVDGAACGDIVAVAKLKDTSTGDTICDQGAQITYAPPKRRPSAITFAIHAAKTGDEDKIFQGLAKLAETDPSLKLRRDKASGTLLSGMGTLHIDATLKKLKRKFGVEANTAPPKIAYRETIKGTVNDQRYRHKKQTGGKGQFAEVIIDIAPTQRGEGFVFDNAIVGGAIPRQFIPAVEKGIVETMADGVIAGYPVVDLRVRLHDGKFHDVDSSEMAFKIAARMAFKAAIRDSKARAVLLEPIVDVEVTVPEENMGDVMGDISSRRGRPMGMESRGKYQCIKAQVPHAEMLRYSPDLRSMTGGRGDFVADYSHYEEVPRDVAEKIIAQYKDEDEE